MLLRPRREGALPSLRAGRRDDVIVIEGALLEQTETPQAPSIRR
ncbi:hypothetical protein ACIBI9_22150 [Nonomuraea sp. NPDC050451]